MAVRLQIIISLLLLISVIVFAGGEYTLSGTKTFIITNRWELKNVGRYNVNNVVATLYLGANTTAALTDPPALFDSLYQRKDNYTVSPQPSELTVDRLGNNYGKFEIGTISPGRKIDIVVKKTVTNSGIVISHEVLQSKPDYESFLSDKANLIYVSPGPKMESGSKEIKQVADQYAAIPGKTVAERLLQYFDSQNIKTIYDVSPIYAHKGALNALRTNRGVCTEFAGLFVAVCRAMGVPARIVNGYWIRNKEITTTTAINVQGDHHAWAEFYLPAAGWVPVEPTITTTLNGKRIPSSNFFAAIPTTDRHFIMGYGLEDEVNTGISCDYSVPQGAETGNYHALQTNLAEETVQLAPDTNKVSY